MLQREPMRTATRAFYDEKYARTEEIQRSSKMFTVDQLTPAGRLVLDIGCGTGVNSERVAAAGHSVVGVDLSREAIGKYHARRFDGLVCDIEAGLPFAAGTFDAALWSEVIEHIVNPEVALREIRRVLRPGGELVLSTPNSAFWLYRVAAVVGRTVSELQHPKHLHFFSRRGLLALLRTEGFEIELATGRNMFPIVGAPQSRTIARLLVRLGFTEERRFVTGQSFWHYSWFGPRLNSLMADTLVVRAVRS